mgnify:CR=1 FL=1
MKKETLYVAFSTQKGGVGKNKRSPSWWQVTYFT